MRVLIRSMLVLIFLVSATSCARTRTEISGTITRDGKPLELDVENGHFIVIFVPENRRANQDPYKAETDPATGAYKIAELRAGTYLVAVHLFDGHYRDQLANKYDPNHSPLRVEVTDDGQVIDIDIPLELPK